MPLDYTENVWRALYRAHDNAAQEWVGYGRRWYENFYRAAPDGREAWLGPRLDAIVNEFAPATNASVLVVGVAYGFLIEALLDRGFTDVYGVDNSQWIADTIADEGRADVTPRIVHGWTVGVDPSNDIKSALQAIGAPRTYDIVVDEDAVSSHTDAEIPAFHAGLEDLIRGNQSLRVVHLTSPIRADGLPGQAGINWKTMAQWKATAPGHTWVNAQTGEVA